MRLNLLPLLLLLVVGGEYFITDTSGREFVRKVIKITPSGDYLVARPLMQVGTTAGKPNYRWDKTIIFLDPRNISEAEVIRLPSPQQQTDRRWEMISERFGRK